MTPAERKQESERYLESLGVPINPHLPALEDQAAIKFREADEVAKRIIVLYQMVSVGHGRDSDKSVAWLEREGLLGELTARESEFLRADDPDPDEVFRAQWQLEAVFVLLWSIGHIDSLGMPEQLCNSRDFIDGIPFVDDETDTFIKNARLRSPTEILDKADLIYRVHWAMRDLYLRGESDSLSLRDDVAALWHHATEWLIGNGTTWNKVDTST